MTKQIEPVFQVTVAVSMAEVLEQAVSTDEYEGDVSMWIENGAVQKALMDNVADRISRLFDRNVLNGIQQLAQAEIKDQLSKKIPGLIDDALSGPASKFPTMTLKELLESEVQKQFEFREADRGMAPSTQTKLGQLIENRVNAEMRNIEKRLREVVSEVVVERLRETAEGMVDGTKAA